jgi:hypothetical protein
LLFKWKKCFVLLLCATGVRCGTRVLELQIGVETRHDWFV